MDTLNIPNSFIYKTGERIVPGSVTDDALIEHCARYKFSTGFCKGKKVLNVSSGSGFGSVLLLQEAKEVYNIDISDFSIAYGNKKYGTYNNHFLSMDAEQMNFPDEYFDVIVSFETIEHLYRPLLFINECFRVLKKNGTAIISTPNKFITSHDTLRPKNKFHIHEWNINQLTKMIEKKFTVNKTYGQHFVKQDKAYTRQEIIFMKIISFLMSITPGFIYKFIKLNILKYKDRNILNLEINRSNIIIEADISDFYPNVDKYAFSIIILHLIKK